ncbi:ubiquitin carboxyl-terminal hydrolase 5, putative [Entamoeba histolytica HM-3:IMSS]|uniref:Ubiquitin carboxyl-terminal hydrolase n=6 Tax=Entamoeba histolytica TaxID=5759 RepID=C4LUJ2_ENTH1|nr:ubiquitin carboxyl-terminal hydrolase 5, putative [Entamoeba histolytica HM-1:IMSS]EAL51065.2 ubiquitin carboxyl-terminal hydrolase 5, putative [Entamoeba histolytica HM-1:IMSS]EMD47679.1 ubiquitin carboxylterminal hydrolase, putative [Entamoeba histolytica KU27]EMS17756.1 ubiquitin carboxyl-terminal hydrolase 5, putative [Entamoeba histolytica HM-3:IMSS]GAT92281.1 ubiquitin carboxyl-terminal hydrolase 5 putative [Entamoeba histolytica]|eukprot:XP_656454.2 ubiquitin carboxyl-terminal hydrolase 5, putative [Entamoeba histolytica HM-1:IMSS]
MNLFVVPSTYPEIHKTDCMYCPVSIGTQNNDKLYICLMDGQSFCEECLHIHQEVSGHQLYLVIHEIQEKEEDDFFKEKKKEYWIEKEEENKERINIESLEEGKIKDYIKYIIGSIGVEKKVCESENNRTRIYTENIQQIARSKKLDLNNIQCEEEGCDVKDNLWLNLIDGSVYCGREQMMVKGHSHALKHYEKTKRPLVVKIGTISSDGTADMYDYNTDEDVRDPLLKEHLGFYGIDISKLSKTQLSLDEIAKEAALKMERDRIEEIGIEHKICYGPYKTGIRNSGNTCYAASGVQLIFGISEVRNKLKQEYQQLIRKNWKGIEYHMTTQMAKLAQGFVSGKCSEEEDNTGSQVGMSIIGLKQGLGHYYQMYKTNEQQDSSEFVLHLIDRMEQEGFKEIQENLEVVIRNEIKGEGMSVNTTREKIIEMGLDVPYMVLIERKHIDLHMEDIIKMYGSVTPIEGYQKNGRYINATKRIRIGKFPKYLLIKLERQIALSYEDVRKVDADVFGMERIDLSMLKSNNKEEEKEEKVEINQEKLEVLSSMGFDEIQAKTALRITNNDIEEAIMKLTSGEIKEIEDTITDKYREGIVMMKDMGFDEESSRKALEKTKGDIEQAIIFAATCNEEKENKMEEEKENKMEEEGNDDDRSGKYELIGFVSHIGANVNCGHYVCHMKQGDEWIMFNDNKVYQSQNPPFTRGYLYLYKSIE